MAKRVAFIIIGLMSAGFLGVAAANYFQLQYPMNLVREADTRNEDIRVFVHYKYFINPNVLVYDLREVSKNSSPMDVTRVLLQFAEREKEKSFESVELSYQGHGKFIVKGDYFQRLGQEFRTQNPVYTVRTLPENLYKLDGNQAFGTWTGGILGVLGRQMEDFVAWHRAWYINELSPASKEE